ncbi:MAG: hypothetical protein ACTHNS_10585 [Marmoricola sp.]
MSSSRATWPVRIVAGLTTAYSTALVAAPRLLAKPAGLAGPGGSVPPGTAALIRSIGVRDAALAAALALAPAGRPMALLTGARVVSDAADAVWFAGVVPKSQRTKISGAALGWAALETLVELRARRAA